MLVSDGARVRDCVCRLVAAYLLAVGAAVSGVPVPTAHFQALHLTRTTRLARLCDGAGSAGSDQDSDDEAWLRDDLPSARWLPVVRASPAASPPPTSPPHPVSALSRECMRPKLYVSMVESPSSAFIFSYFIMEHACTPQSRINTYSNA